MGNNINKAAKTLEEGCADHAYHGGTSMAHQLLGADELKLAAISGAVMKQCLEDGGIENYKNNLVKKYEQGGHGLPPEADKPMNRFKKYIPDLN